MPFRSLLLSVCAVVSCGASARAQDITTDLVAHWEFDETSGSVAADSSGNGNDGTAVNHSWVSGGKIGGCIELDGSNDYVAVTNSSSLQISGDITLAAWVNADTVSGEHCIVGHGPTSSAVQNTYLYAWYGDWIGGARNGSDLYAQSSASTGDWRHVVAVHNGSQWRLFVNGVLVDTLTTSQGAVNVSGRWGIGAPSSYTSRFFDGLIDEVRIYSRALSDTDVAALHAYDGTGGGLVAHYKLDETSGATASDSSASGNDGALTASGQWTSDGPRGGGLDFEVDDGVDRVDATSPQITGDELTVAIWFNQEEPSNDARLIINSSSNKSVDQSWGTTVDENGNLDFRVKAGGAWDRVEVAGAVSPGVWRHAVGVYDGVDMRLYLDGELIGSKAHSVGGDLDYDASHTVTLGDSPVGSRAFDGKLEDARVYSVALGEAEIATLYGLVGHWDFDEGSGTTIADNTGVAGDATFNTGAPTWIDGVRGNALEFDGTNDARTDEQVEPSERGAVAFWMRSDGTPGSRQRPWGVGADFEVWQDSDGLVSMDVSTDGLQGGFITTEPLDTAGRWYHVVAQYDSADNSYEIYLNGVLHKSGVSTWNITQQPADYLTFGTRTGNTQRFSGALDDFRIYNRWLTVTEIAEVYGLIGHWKHDETSGATAADSSGMGHDGVYVGGPTLGSATASLAPTGTAVEFDGGSQHVTTARSLMNGLEEFSIAGWVKPSSTSPDRSFFGQNDLVELGIDYAEDQLDFWTANGGWIAASYTLPVDSWTHLVAVGDGSELRLYANGVLIATGGFSTSGYGSNSDVFKIGEGVLDPTGDPFVGAMDDVRLYNRAISPEEVRELYYGDYTPGLRIVRWVEVANP